MFRQMSLFGMWLCVLCLVAPGSAQIISVTFVNAGSGSPGQMDPTDLAGAPGVRVAHWNNLTNLNQTLGDDESVVYDDGTAVDGIGIGIDTPRNWSNRDNNSAYQNDQIMYNGVIDCFNDITTLTLTNVSFTQYDVYFYMRDDGIDRAGSFTLIGGPTYYLRGATGNPTANGEGYVLSTDTTITSGVNASIDPGNYTVFEGLSGDSVFEITAVNAGDGVMRNKWAGFQIVGTSDPYSASNPLPTDKATDVPRDITLSWSGSQYAATHDVYFGTSFDDVNDGIALVSENQDANSFTPGPLAFGQAYYWRVDEVNAAPDNTIFEGAVWQFTVEPYSNPVDGSSITATASSVSSNATGPEKTIDGSGLDENDGHSITLNDMWSSANPDPAPWIQYNFDSIQKLDKMLVWNANQQAEAAVGWGAKDVLIETSLDGSNWITVDGVAQFTQSSGTEGAGPTDSVDLGGAVAQYVRISITSNWGGILNQYSLSEVRFFAVPVQARESQPSPGTTGVLPDAVLRWRAGREAVTHDVYMDTDVNAVLDGSAPSTTVNDNSLGLASLDLPIGETYFWKVNEVNVVEDPSVWAGPIWDFSIPDPLVVDDFESYSTSNIPMRPYVTWRDGLDFSNPSPGGSGNGTGSIVGHDIFSPGSPYFDGDLMELELFHGGSQSLPLYYDNSGANGNADYSEMTRTFSSPQDWSGNAIRTLTLYFRGVEGNTGQLYVKINNTKLAYTDDPGAISRPMWEQWNIDLASTNANLSNVQSISVGIENRGSGLVYVDDIVLYRNAPAPVQGTDPGAAGLVASYSMENNVNDSTGAYNGTIIGNPTYVTGVEGMALSLDGVDDYVDLPIGGLIATLSDITVASWVNFSTEAEGNWHRVFDFGTGTTNYMFLSTSSGGGATGPARFAILTPDIEGESSVDGLVALPAADWHHVAVSIDSSTMTITLYVDGSVVASSPTEALPQDLGETTQNYLGDSQWEGDAFYEGSLDEFMIYDHALSEAEIRYLAGEQ